MRLDYKPIPLTVMCMLLIFIGGLSLYFDVSDIVSFGNEFGSLYDNILTVCLSILVIAASLFVVLGKKWAWKTLIGLLGFFFINSVLGIFISSGIEPSPFDQFISAALLLAMLTYLLKSQSVKSKFDKEKKS